VRTQVAFYASTPSYRAFLDYHGLGHLGQALRQHLRANEPEAMAALIPDCLMDAVAVSEAAGEPGLQLQERYADGLAQRLMVYEPLADDNEAFYRQLLATVRGQAS